jgi:tripartite-type tricarboxylate transporter receptor subunit TctC
MCAKLEQDSKGGNAMVKTTMIYKVAKIFLLLTVFTWCIGVSASFAAWPERPITLVCPWGAGGGTDTVARTLAAIMEKNLGQPINVVNRTGGSGIIGHTALANAKPDGYTIGTINVDLCQLVSKGLTDLTYEKFTQIALINAAPAGVCVNSDSTFKTAGDLISAIKMKPAKTFKASGTGTGGIWHLAFAGWMHKADIDPARVIWVPSKGEAPSLKDLATGSVDVITVPLSSALALIKAGKVRPLANMDTVRFEPLPDVPTLKEATGTDWTTYTWRMIGAPAGVSDDIRDKLTASVKKAFDSKEFTDFMNSRGFKKVWKGPAEAREFHKSEDQAIGMVMKAVGMAK